MYEKSINFTATEIFSELGTAILGSKQEARTAMLQLAKLLRMPSSPNQTLCIFWIRFKKFIFFEFLAKFLKSLDFYEKHFSGRFFSHEFKNVGFDPKKCEEPSQISRLISETKNFHFRESNEFFFESEAFFVEISKIQVPTQKSESSSLKSHD